MLVTDKQCIGNINCTCVWKSPFDWGNTVFCYIHVYNVPVIKECSLFAGDDNEVVAISLGVTATAVACVLLLLLLLFVAFFMLRSYFKRKGEYRVIVIVHGAVHSHVGC